MFNFLTVHLESTDPHLFRHLSESVYIKREGSRVSYWCDTGLFWLNEVEQAQAHAERVKRKGLKTSIISRTLT